MLPLTLRLSLGRFDLFNAFHEMRSIPSGPAFRARPFRPDKQVNYQEMS